MFSKTKKTERIDAEQREQYEYARRRIKQKKTLMRHFILFLVGSVLLIIINPILGYGNELLFNNWFVWAILIWTFIFLVHLFNVFVINKFMDKEWEDRQLEKLKARQAERIAELQKKVDTELQLPTTPPNTPKKKRTEQSITARRTMITMIAAAGENNELGKDNDLLWHLPDDFKRFKEMTTGHHIIMGRKTFESFPKPLPNRTHIVITRNKGYKKQGAVVVHGMEEALQIAKNDLQPFIIGGGEIYKMGIPTADKIELTRVHGTFKDADTFFPEFSEKQWELIFRIEHEKDEKHKYSFTYETWVRK